MTSIPRPLGMDAPARTCPSRGIEQLAQRMDLHRFRSGLLRAILATKETDMAAIHSDEVKRDPVRFALTRGPTRGQVASDLGIGPSTRGQVGSIGLGGSQGACAGCRGSARERTAAQIKPYSLGLSRTRKQSGRQNSPGDFFPGEWRAAPKKRRCSSWLKSRDVSV